MEVIPAVLEGLALVAEPSRLIYVIIGVVAGILVGLMPGAGGTTGVALLLPFAAGLEPVSGLGMIIGLYAATSTSDTLPAVLFAIPGSSSSQATILDGHPMARNGEAGRAFGAAFSASLIGGIIGVVVLSILIQTARPLIMNFQSPELFALGVLGMSMVAVLTGSKPLKGLIAAGVGLMLSMVGMDGFTGTVRWNYGSLYLFDGIPLAILALSVFAVPEIIYLMVKGQTISSRDVKVGGGFSTGIRDTLQNKFLVFRTSMIGIFCGLMPGLGGNVVDWLSYAHAKQTVPGARKTFGSGDVRGVIGVDASTNAKDGSAMVTTLLFSIPGSTPMALLLGLFIVYGIEPGPEMVTTHLSLTYSMVWSLLVAQIAVFVLCSMLVRPLARITMIPFSVLAPPVLVVIVFAVFQASGSHGDLVLFLALCGLGWCMKWYGWPRPPFTLGFVLGPLLERWLFISTSRYGAFGWLDRPIVMVVMALTVVSLATVIRPRRRRGNLADRAKAASLEGVEVPAPASDGQDEEGR